MKKLLLTGHDLNMRSTLLRDNKEKYAKKYKWDFICKTSYNFDKNRPAAFSKITWIIKYLKQYDLVFWNDFDSAFTNFNIDISTSLEQNAIGMFEEHANYFCSGNILIKSCDFSKQLFNITKSLPSWHNDTHPWEQRPLNEAIALQEFKNIKKFTKSQFGAFYEELDWVKSPWQKGDFMIHLINNPKRLKTWKDRVSLFQNKYSKLIVE